MSSTYRHVPVATLAARIQAPIDCGISVQVELVSDDGMHWEADETDFTHAGLAAALAAVDDAGGPSLTLYVADLLSGSFHVEGGQVYAPPLG